MHIYNSRNPVPNWETRPRWPIGKVSALGRRVPGSKPNSTEDLSCIVRTLPDQVSSSSFDRCSKFQSPSQNSPRVASKRDVNTTKTNWETTVKTTAATK
ncbi:hypothetical protein AVEN_25502-1 [Araneus ventricosus]|uniref:Uncharacterized protein n=1 Tax=Araneus ventricosus TaxID=182803 RepID=A0A4Y2CS67_ARAVE|nr:hypothetical protein AVEN_25502-1 [Araneus ventricosus]